MNVMKLQCPDCFTTVEIGIPQTPIELQIISYEIRCSVCKFQGSIDIRTHSVTHTSILKEVKFPMADYLTWVQSVKEIVRNTSGWNFEDFRKGFLYLNAPFYFGQYVDALLEHHYWLGTSPLETSKKFFKLVWDHVAEIRRDRTPKELGKEGVQFLGDAENHCYL